METHDLIPANEFCTSHQIEISFIRSLEESGLIELVTIEQKGFIPMAQLQQLEKIVRLYYEMDINLEGIETITHLLQHIHSMKKEIIRLTNELRFYQPDL